MKKSKKMMYVPPTVEVIKVVLEEVMTTSPMSPVQHIDLKNWEEDIPNATNNADIWVNF